MIKKLMKPLILFLEMLFLLILYKKIPDVISINIPTLFLFMIVFILVWILTWYWMPEPSIRGEMAFTNLSAIWFFAVIIGIFYDSTHIYEQANLNKEVSFWFFSAMLQGFSALLGIVAAFSIFQLQSLKKDKKIETLKEIMKSFFPAIIYIILVLIISILCLPFSYTLSVEKYQSTLATIISVAIFLSITSIISIFISLLKSFTQQET